MAELLKVNTRVQNANDYRQYLESSGITILKEWQEDNIRVFKVASPPPGYVFDFEPPTGVPTPIEKPQPATTTVTQPMKGAAQPPQPATFTEAEKAQIIADPHTAFDKGIISEQTMAAIINANQKAASTEAIKEQMRKQEAATPEAKVLYTLTRDWLGSGTLFSLGTSLLAGKTYEEWLGIKQQEREEWIKGLQAAQDTGKTSEWIAEESLRAGAALGLGMAGGGVFGKVGTLGAKSAMAGFTGLQVGETIKNPTKENIIASAGMLALMVPIVKSTYSEGQVIKAARQSETRTVIGKSLSIPKDNEIFSQGKFQVTEGKLKGLKGTTTMEQNVEKGRGYTTTTIPKQKIGGKTVLGKTIGEKKIPFQESTAYTQELKPVQIETTTLLHRISNKMKIMAGKEGDIRTVKPVGADPVESFLQEIGKLSKGKVEVTRYKGVSNAPKVSEYNLEIVKTAKGTAMIEASDITGRITTKIGWVDIATKTTGRGTGGKVTPFKTGNLDIVSGMASTLKATPAIPVLGNIKVDVGPRIVPNVNPVPELIRIKMSPDLVTPVTQIQVDIPKIIRKEEDKQKGRTVTPNLPAIQTGSGTLGLLTPQITKNWDTSKLKINPVQVPITNPITGQTQSRESVTAIRQQLEPLVNRIANQPVPDIPNVPPMPPGIKIPWLPPGFYGLGSSKFKRNKTSHITNPIPEIEKVV